MEFNFVLENGIKSAAVYNYGFETSLETVELP